MTRAAGFRLTVRPTVFHPRYFISSERFAEFISSLDLTGKRVIDIGTGSGILALAAARAGARHVIATDINPNAALNATDNAGRNGLGDRITGVCCDLLSALAPRPMFDVILSSPPKHAGEPRDLADRGWHAGPHYRDVAALFDQSRQRLNPGGRLYVMVSSDSDLALFGRLIDKPDFTAGRLRAFDTDRVVYHLRARGASSRLATRTRLWRARKSFLSYRRRPVPMVEWNPSLIGMAGGDTRVAGRLDGTNSSNTMRRSTIDARNQIGR